MQISHVNKFLNAYLRATTKISVSGWHCPGPKSKSETPCIAADTKFLATDSEIQSVAKFAISASNISGATLNAVTWASKKTDVLDNFTSVVHLLTGNSKTRLTNLCTAIVFQSNERIRAHRVAPILTSFTCASAGSTAKPKLT